MSWDFINIKTVNGRKAYRCEQCHKPIEAGMMHVYVAGRVEGDFMAYREHGDCREACLAHAEHADRDFDSDGYTFLADDDDRDDDFILARWPDVASRLGIARPMEVVPS